jgi:hypothetical protein
MPGIAVSNTMQIGLPPPLIPAKYIQTKSGFGEMAEWLKAMVC